MSFPKKIAIASGNAGKMQEIKLIFQGLGIHFLSQKELGVKESDEPYDTFLENALSKARHVSKQTGLPAMADDSGICASALDGRPGVKSARFYGQNSTDKQNNDHLIELMSGCTDRRVYYYCALVMVRKYDDPVPLISDGRWFGELLRAPRGEGGFGYDPLFVPDGFDLSFAELGEDVKNRLSHRARALAKLKVVLCH